ncbi:MAG TPA: hypothetical protein VK730_13640 [Solirubrobacteraceae bacterium]|jgi:hypothetical protein|nr:hypothetical protein [Solirubrobacteraceae bacterium]
MQRASLTQVRAGRNGKLIEIDADVMDICNRIREIDSSLGVDWNEDGNYFRVYQLVQGGEKHVVTTTRELTPEVVEEVRRIANPGYNLASELERLDDQADRDNQHAFQEKVGEGAERLRHAMRKDLQLQDRIYLPRSVDA